MFDPFSLGVLAVSALAKMQANEDAADRRESIRQSMEAFQRRKAQEVQAATDQLINRQTPKARTEEASQIVQDRTQSLKDTVGAAQAFNAPSVAGKLSDDYKSVDEANAMRIGERTRRAIEQIALMGAPAEEQQASAIRYGRAAGTVDAANRASDNVGRAYQTDIANVRPDPFMSMLGDAGMAVGTAMAGMPETAVAEPTPSFGDPEWGLMSPTKPAPSSIFSRFTNAMQKITSPPNNNTNSIWGPR